MEYLVTMTTHVPEGVPDEDVQQVRAREAGRSRELAAQQHLLRLWRPPLGPGEWRTLGLFAAASDQGLEKVLASMPLRVWSKPCRLRLRNAATPPTASAIGASSKTVPTTAFTASQSRSFQVPGSPSSHSIRCR